jgi:hypothetical protein
MPRAILGTCQGIACVAQEVAKGAGMTEKTNTVFGRLELSTEAEV